MPIKALQLPETQSHHEEIPQDAEHLHALSNPEDAAQKADNIFATNVNLKARLEKRKAEIKIRADYLKVVINQKNIALLAHKINNSGGTIKSR